MNKPDIDLNMIGLVMVVSHRRDLCEYLDKSGKHIATISSDGYFGWYVDYFPIKHVPRRRVIDELVAYSIIEVLADMNYKPALVYIRQQKIDNLFI